MAELVPQTFPVTPESAIASYNYFDIAEGTGIVVFYGNKVATAPSTYEYILTGDGTVHSETNGKTDALNTFDEDFDVVFNRPKTVNGTLTAVIPIAARATSGTVTANVTVTIIHYDGSTETTIGTAITSPNLSTTTTSAVVSEIRVLKFSISETKFKKGDTLRVNIAGAHSGNVASSHIGHSPIGSQSTSTGQAFVDTGTSRLSVYVPFELDL